MKTNKYIIILNECGIGIRINEDKFKSYSYHNFKTPLNYGTIEYQKLRWSRFLRLCIRIMTNVTIIKNNKCVFRKEA